MTAPITVADLVAQCGREGVDPAAAILFIDREIPVLATDSDPTFGRLDNGVSFFGLMLSAVGDDFDDED